MQSLVIKNENLYSVFFLETVISASNKDYEYALLPISSIEGIIGT